MLAIRGRESERRCPIWSHRAFQMIMRDTEPGALATGSDPGALDWFRVVFP